MKYQEAIENIKESIKVNHDGKLVLQGNLKPVAVDMAIEALEKQDKYDWLPCSERNPDKDGFYLATISGELCGEEGNFTGMAEYLCGKWTDDDVNFKAVIAWQQLPKPYEAEKKTNDM